ncbi:MAG: addiction module protein [Verrucomicrobiales bacterium]|nr:addiction module protein [Verrucomicrobiales bacterium]
MSYTESMTITYQTLMGEDGEPTAALIPWDEFRVIKAELEVAEDTPLSPEWKAELDRRSRELDDGSVKGIPHDEMIERVRETLRNHSSSKQRA